MDLAIQVFLMGDARFITFAFLITGVLVYFIDYKKFSKAGGREREARFCKWAAWIYGGGSLCMFLFIQLLDWFS